MFRFGFSSAEVFFLLKENAKKIPNFLVSTIKGIIFAVLLLLFERFGVQVSAWQPDREFFERFT